MFQLALPLLVHLEHRAGASAKGAVVEKNDIGVEEEMVTEGHGGDSLLVIGYGCVSSQLRGQKK